MVRILLVLVVVAAIVSGGIYFLSARQKSSPESLEMPTATYDSPVTTAQSPDEKIKKLEMQIAELSKKTVPSTSFTDPLVNSKISSLETTVLNLQTKINQLSGSQTTSTTSQLSSETKIPVYIPVGNAGPVGDRNYYDISGTEVSVNASDYPGFTSMQLEVNMKLSEAVGTGYARLYNVTDSSAVSGSETSVTSAQYSVVSSSGFKPSSGKKTYRLQLKSSEGKDLYAQNARLRVNF